MGLGSCRATASSADGPPVVLWTRWCGPSLESWPMKPTGTIRWDCFIWTGLLMRHDVSSNLTWSRFYGIFNSWNPNRWHPALGFTHHADGPVLCSNFSTGTTSFRKPICNAWSAEIGSPEKNIHFTMCSGITCASSKNLMGNVWDTNIKISNINVP